MPDQSKNSKPVVPQFPSADAWPKQPAPGAGIKQPRRDLLQHHQSEIASEAEKSAPGPRLCRFKAYGATVETFAREAFRDGLKEAAKKGVAGAILFVVAAVSASFLHFQYNVFGQAPAPQVKSTTQAKELHAPWSTIVIPTQKPR